MSIVNRAKAWLNTTVADSGPGLWAVRRATTPRTGASASGPAVLIAPPGHGNIGDQALVEAYLENVPGPVVVVTRRQGDVVVPAEHADRVTTRALPGVVYGGMRERLRGGAALRALTEGASRLDVVGADIMDGGYNPRPSVNRALLATWARQGGVPASVLGFSWKKGASPVALAALREAGAAGVRLLLRDPRSAARATADGVTGVVSTSDMVFSARTIDTSEADRVVAELGEGPYVVVNASGLVAGAYDQGAEYLRIVRAVREAGYRVIVLPHVSRPGADDLPECRALVEAAADDGVVLVDHLLTPAQVRGFCAITTATVTGRMHLAVMTLSAGHPALTLATQGKVEGLMEMFALPQLCVEPAAGLADRVLEVLLPHLADPAPLTDAVAAALPEVREKSALNFTP